MYYVITTTILLAGAEGIEPSSAVLETDILPLNYAPIDCTAHTLSHHIPNNSLRQDSTRL